MMTGTQDRMTLREARQMIDRAFKDNFMDRIDRRVWLAGIRLEPKDTLYYSGEEMMFILKKMKEQKMLSDG